MQAARFSGVRYLIPALSFLLTAAGAAEPPPTLADAVIVDPGLVPFGGSVYFTASGPAPLEQLWASDGTPGGTLKLWEFEGGPTPSMFTAAGSRLFFFAGKSLWFVEANAVTHAADLPRAPSAAAELGGEVVFILPGGGADDVEVWASDGTPGGTRRIRTLARGLDAEAPTTLTRMGGRLYFWLTIDRYATLWQTEGTFGSTIPNIEFGPISSSSGPTPVAFGDRLAFISSGNPYADLPYRLWVTDGTEAGLSGLTSFAGTDDIVCNTGCPKIGPTDLTAAGGRLFFIADGEGQGRELWASDGTLSGTVLVRNIIPGPASGLYRGLMAVGDRVYFSATSNGHGTELWVSEGTEATTRSVVDLVPGPDSSGAQPASPFGDRLLFTTIDEAAGTLTLWVTNGSLAGTRAIRDFAVGTGSSGFAPIPGHVMFFERLGDGGSILWKTDGTPAGTESVAAFPATGGARLVHPIPRPPPDTRTLEPRP